MSRDTTPPSTDFGNALASRVLPRTRTIHRSLSAARPGALAGRVVEFAASLGVPSFANVGIEPSTLADPAHQTVRPPIDNWLWGEAEQPEPDPVERTLGRPSAASAGTVRRAPRRGLPLTTRRRQHTLGGARTAPGAIARTLLPNTDTNAPIEASSVLRRQRATETRTPRPAPAAATPSAAASAARSTPRGTAPAGRPNATEGLPPDLQRLQRMLIRDGLMQPKGASDQPDPVPPSVMWASDDAAPVSGQSAGPGRPRAATPVPAEPDIPRDIRRARDTAPRASAEGRIDRHVVSASRARREDAADPPMAPRPSPFADDRPDDGSRPVPAESVRRSPFDGGAPSPVTSSIVPSSTPVARPASPQRQAGPPIVRRNADLGRPTTPDPTTAVEHCILHRSGRPVRRGHRHRHRRRTPPRRGGKPSGGRP